jgi:hypothetical protein
MMINEVSKPEFRAEFFNLLNKTNFGTPSGTAMDIVFGADRTAANGERFWHDPQHGARAPASACAEAGILNKADHQTLRRNGERQRPGFAATGA